MLIDEGLELLDEPEVMRLLANCEVGRVGVTIGALPAIFPVNYRLIDGCVVFRSSPGSKLSAAANRAVVAFEVDDYNVADRSGWSVLAVGPSEVVHDLDGLKTKLHQMMPDEPIEVYSAQRSIILKGRASNISQMNAAFRIAERRSLYLHAAVHQRVVNRLRREGAKSLARRRTGPACGVATGTGALVDGGTIGRPRGWRRLLCARRNGDEQDEDK